MSKLSKYRLLLFLAAAVLLLDQVSKLWIAHSLPFNTFYPEQGAIVIIPDVFHIVHVGNTGAAWSMFSDYTWALTLIGFIVLSLIVVFRKQLELDKREIQLSYGLIIGGIIGNIVDRVRIQHVIDFLDFHWNGHHFPTFNVADSGITVGVALYIWFSFRTQKTDTAGGSSETP